MSDGLVCHIVRVISCYDSIVESAGPVGDEIDTR